MAMLTQDERRAAWLLSDLFLDTARDEDDYNRTAKNLSELGMDLAAIENLLWHDVFRILFPNALSVAGEWAVFDQDWVCELIE